MRALAAAAAIALGSAAIGAGPSLTQLRGYTLQNSARERDTEAQFADVPTVQKTLEYAAAIGARPHYAGTPADYALAVYMRDTLRAGGISAELESFTTRVDTPRELVVELAPDATSPPPAKHLLRKRRSTEFPLALELSESAESSDSATAAKSVGVPFNAGSGDGDLRAPLVFADRGLGADYATLASADVDVRNAILLVRYGAQFRGLLAERAQAHGAAGVIFYSDPKDDGSTRGEVYPNGPWRPLTAVQRGSVGTHIRIPTIPISAANAQVLLGTLHGVAGPPTWGGTLPVAYPLARGPGRVHLIVKMNHKLTTLWNTIGVIPGVHGDQSVVLGAHRDAWVYGVGDNGDGITTMLEVARGFGVLLKGGWRPQRSIVIAGWDGEEIGLAGSQAYVARHRIELERGCVAYFNADENITGPIFGADAAAAIAPALIDATQAVHDPLAPATSVYDRWAAQTPRSFPLAQNPSGGSDHEAFLYGLGIPIANMGFRGPFGVYHSSYDTLRYATLFSDPGFALHRTTAQLYGVAGLRLADADVVPYTFGAYVALLRTGAADIAARAKRDQTPVEIGPFLRAIDRYAKASARTDMLVAQLKVNAAREIRAARALDSLVYGVSGYTGVLFPDIDAAFLLHDSSAINAAIARAVDAVLRASATLSM